jgi:hypothetical protein
MAGSVSCKSQYFKGNSVLPGQVIAPKSASWPYAKTLLEQMISISYYRNIKVLKTLNSLMLRNPAPPFGAFGSRIQSVFFRSKLYSRRILMQASVQQLHRDNLVRNFLTAANTAYMQWRPFDCIIHLISPNLYVPGPRLRPCLATAHTRKR